MSIASVLGYTLKYANEEEGWIHPLGQAVGGLTAAQAAWKPSPQRHSIWQIVRHVIHWKQPMVDRWDGKPVLGGDDLNASDWQQVSGDEADWQADVRRLLDLHQEVRRRVEAADDATLMSPFPGAKQPRALTIGDMTVHDGYHAGQIRYVRALQGV